ncbi:MAG: hypothetical protein NTZ01_06285 [Verrucomicrobia bacterium]|nr:hypothetical protein [Verrucomicrobiota bacterium]
MAHESQGPAHSGQARLRPRLYGVAIYLVAGILLLQVIFCISVFFLRPYAKAKTPEGILQSERVKAGEWWSGLTRFLHSRVQNSGPEPRGFTNAPVPPPAK